MVRTQGLIHLVVRDLERSLAFYQGVFGMEEQHSAGAEYAYVADPDGCVIEL